MDKFSAIKEENERLAAKNAAAATGEADAKAEEKKWAWPLKDRAGIGEFKREPADTPKLNTLNWLAGIELKRKHIWLKSKIKKQFSTTAKIASAKSQMSCLLPVDHVWQHEVVNMAGIFQRRAVVPPPHDISSLRRTYQKNDLPS